MEVFPASVVLILRALVVSARCAGRTRWCALVCLLGGDGAALSSASSWAVTVLTAATGRMAEARIAHMHNCTAPAGVGP
jgi:hypothetical protein